LLPANTDIDPNFSHTECPQIRHVNPGNHEQVPQLVDMERDQLHKTTACLLSPITRMELGEAKKYRHLKKAASNPFASNIIPATIIKSATYPLDTPISD
jgi:hypothetical protein